MSMLMQLYEKHAPRWFKVIRWRANANYFLESQKRLCFILYGPVFLILTNTDNPTAIKIFFNPPKTEEELMEIKRNSFFGDMYQRNWEIDQYQGQMAPRYDLWERRRKYPQYYEGRYDGYKRDGKAVAPRKEE